MIDTNETGRILKEKAKKWRGASNAMNIDATAPQLSPTTLSSEPGTSWVKWVPLLQTRLADCPTDTLTRCARASLLEELGKPEEALCHWSAALVYNPDNLKTQEGMVQLRVIGIAVDQVALIVKQSEAPRRVGSIRPPHTFFSHHEPPALLARHDAFAIGLPPYA